MHNDSKLQNFNLFESREQFELNQSQLNENDISFIPYDQEEVTTEGVTNSVMEKLASTGDNNQVLAIGNQSEKVKARSLVTFALVVDTEIDLTTCKNNSENYTIIYDVLNNITYQKNNSLWENIGDIKSNISNYTIFFNKITKKLFYYENETCICLSGN